MKLYDIEKKWNVKKSRHFHKRNYFVVVFGWSPLTRIPFQGYINTGFRIFSIRKPSIAVSREIERKKMPKFLQSRPQLLQLYPKNLSNLKALWVHIWGRTLSALLLLVICGKRWQQWHNDNGGTEIIWKVRIFGNSDHWNCFEWQ